MRLATCELCGSLDISKIGGAVDRQPTMRAAWLGQELRRLRESKRVTSKEVGQYMGRAQSSISRLEAGLYPARIEDVTSYLDLCLIDDPRRRTELTAMCHEVNQRGWWDGWQDNVASDLMDRMWVEDRTHSIRTCDVTHVPGLLQTPAYARALFTNANPRVDLRELDRWLSFRSTRQHIILRHDPVPLTCLIDEPLLTRSTGDRDVMTSQLGYLETMSTKGHISIRVLPGDRHHGVDSPFELMELTAPYPQIGYVTTAAGDICVEGERVDQLIATYDRLLDIALSTEDSRKLIAARRSES